MRQNRRQVQAGNILFTYHHGKAQPAPGAKVITGWATFPAIFLSSDPKDISRIPAGGLSVAA